MVNRATRGRSPCPPRVHTPSAWCSVDGSRESVPLHWLRWCGKGARHRCAGSCSMCPVIRSRREVPVCSVWARARVSPRPSGERETTRSPEGRGETRARQRGMGLPGPSLQRIFTPRGTTFAFGTAVAQRELQTGGATVNRDHLDNGPIHSDTESVPLPSDECLVTDARAGLTPAQLVERKLVSLLQNTPLPLSQQQGHGQRRPLS